MRYLISLLIVVGIYTWFRFFYTPMPATYPVTSSVPGVEQKIKVENAQYMVPVVYRLAGADLYRAKGSYIYKMPISADAGLFGKLAKKNIGIMRSSAYTDDEVKLLGLRPVYGFWQQYGRWFLLALLAVCLIFIIRGD